MRTRLRRFALACSLLLLVSLACVYLLPDEKLYYPDPEVEVSGEILAQWDATATASARSTAAVRATYAATRKATASSPGDGATPGQNETVTVDQPASGGCYWKNYEKTPPSATTSNPKMEIDVSIQMHIMTTLTHGISGCPDQLFLTQHRWTFSEVMWPGEPQRLEVVFEWLNKGTADCSALVAGGVTSLTVGEVRLKAEEMSINVKTDPAGTVSDTTTWVAPDGEIGDKFTIVVHSSTGSYGTNVRYHFEFVCD